MQGLQCVVAETAERADAAACWLSLQHEPSETPQLQLMLQHPLLLQHRPLLQHLHLLISHPLALLLSRLVCSRNWPLGNRMLHLLD